MKKDVRHVREDYRKHELTEDQTPANPLLLFHQWFEEVEQSGIPDYNACALGTSENGQPHVRIVLLKELDAGGFVFYTNYTSHKGREMEANPRVALTFFWQMLERQVRVEGKVEKVESSLSDAYFAVRPRESQLGAWASPQSHILQSREELEERLREVTARFEGKEVPRPAHWGGYRVVPECLEFWQGRSSRLHDRLVYHRMSDGNWSRQRLAP